MIVGGLLAAIAVALLVNQVWAWAAIDAGAAAYHPVAGDVRWTTKRK